VYYNLSRGECQGVSLENCGNAGKQIAELHEKDSKSHDERANEIVEDNDESDEDDVFHVCIIPTGWGFVNPKKEII
jgi:hypothetical protein